MLTTRIVDNDGRRVIQYKYSQDKRYVHMRFLNYSLLKAFHY
jgi:hypothetical protein